jgi:hypothetical protein
MTTSSDNPRHAAREGMKWSAVVVLATLAFGSVSLVYPFGRDQGIHAFIADSVLHGKVLYREIFNLKPPLTTGVHALALLLFGHSMMAIRLLDLLWTAATGLMLFAFVRQAFGHLRVAALAGVLYALQYYACDFWTTAQTDGWLNLPLAMTFLLVLRGLRDDASPRRVWIGAGVGIGLAAAFKYTVVLACPLLAAMLALWGAGSLRRRLRAAGWLAVGTASIMASLGLGLAAAGAMPAFLESQFGLALAYTRLAAHPGNPVVGFINPLVENSQFHPMLALGLFGGLGLLVMFFLRPEYRRVLGLIFAWALVASFSTLIQRKYFFYQYLPLFTVTSLLGSVVWIAVPIQRRGLRNVCTVLAVSAAFLPLATSSLGERFSDLSAVISGQRTLREHWNSPLYHFNTDFSLRDDLALSDYLVAHTGARQPVFIWGFEPLVYFVSQRPLVSRFPYNYPIVFRWRPEHFRAELMAALSDRAPEIFVVQHGDHLPHVMIHEDDSYATFMALAEVREWVTSRYFLETKVGRFDVYRLQAVPPRI